MVEDFRSDHAKQAGADYFGGIKQMIQVKQSEILFAFDMDYQKCRDD